jgi:spore germination protein (amino acid permease)
LDIADQALGSAGRIAVGMIFLVYLVYISALVLREFGEDMKVIALTDSPISFIIMFFLVGIIVAAYMGIEAIVRLTALIVPVIFIGFLIITIGIMPYFQFGNILPLLGDGAGAILGKGSLKLSNFSAVSIIFFITPFLRTHRCMKTVGYFTISLAGVFFTWSVYSYLLAFPYPTTIEFFIPIYQMARIFEYGRFFQRIESVFLLIWAASALLYLSGGFYFILYVFRKTFGLEHQKPVIWSFAVLLFTLSMLPPNLTSALILETRYFRNYIWIITFAIPIVLLLIAHGVRKNSKKGGKSE